MGTSAGNKIISHPLHRIGIVYNPFAGGLKGDKRARLDAAVDVFRGAGRQVELYATPGPNRAGELAHKAIKDGCDLVLEDRAVRVPWTAPVNDASSVRTELVRILRG